jgi:hypothetical protein
MSDFDITPQSPLQFECEETPKQETPASQLCCSLLSPSQDDSIVLCVGDDEDASVSLAATAKKDEALWDDYISSEDPDFDVDKENDEPESEGEDEDSDSEEDMQHHDACVALADEIRQVLKEKGWKASGSKKEARAALVGALEDHFIAK